MLSAFTRWSSNDKTGKMAVSTTARESCWHGCPFFGSGCYADAGYYTRMHWDKVSAGLRGLTPALFFDQIKKLKPGQRFRHNVAGDLYHDGSFRLDTKLVLALADAASHLKAWTYTHHQRTAANLATIRAAIRRGFTVNLSFENRKEAAKYAKKGYPSVCVVPNGTPANFEVSGVKFRQCPATFDGSPTQCVNCGGANGRPLCAIADRNFVITFPAHGVKSAQAEASCS